VAHEIVKALEVWVLQNLLDASILMGFFALGVALVEPYHRRIEKLLSLRVSIEVWRAATILVVDLMLGGMVLIGLFLLNPDVMADIKMAVPFYPVAVLLAAAALFLRVLGDGSQRGTAAFSRALWFLFSANVVNLVGFSFVMEAPSGEFLEIHPSPFWFWVKTHLRSNAAPAGLEVAHWTFWVVFPVLIIMLLVAFGRGMRQVTKARDQ